MAHVLFRINAGKKIGMGHLTRCMSIAKKIMEFSSVSFMILSDNRTSVEKFIRQHYAGINLRELLFIYTLEKSEEIGLITQFLYKNSAYLVLDHYEVDEEYQLCLKENGIHWFQLDSHAQQVFYADYVHHGSPGATKKLYQDLRGSAETKFLLGTQYVIVDEVFAELHENAKIRERVHNIFVSFGGGDAKGALRKYLPSLLWSFSEITFHAIARSDNRDLSFLREIISSSDNAKLYIDCNYVAEIMFACDLAILAPGGMSYEAATLGLPLVLIAIENNQNINLHGCSDIGIAHSLGCIDEIAPYKLCDEVDDLICDIERLKIMSVNALRNFDGKGAERIRSIFKSEIFKI